MAYANKYYDPEKAHEYYMRTRKLKGYANRYGGARGDGTSAASSGSVILKNTDADKNRANKDRISNAKQEIKTKSDNRISALNSEITSLKAKLSAMSKEDRRKNADAISSYTESLRRQIQDIRNASTDQISALNRESRSGTTSGFTDSAKKSVELLKASIEGELKSSAKKTNKKIDDDMLEEVKRFYQDVRALRENGMGYSKKALLSKIQGYRNRASSAKATAWKNAKDKASQDYTDAINKMRKDEKNFKSYESRQARIKKQTEQQWKRNQQAKLRYEKQKEREKEREDKKKNKKKKK